MTSGAQGPDQGSPVDATRAFVEAVGWGEHRTVWRLLSTEGRSIVLRVAVNQGMEEGMAARLRDGTATDAELDQFLAELVTGLRADLQNIDVDKLEYELSPEPLEDGSIRVELLTPVPPELGSGLPAGSAELSQEDGSWRVNRLVPRRSLSG